MKKQYIQPALKTIILEGETSILSASIEGFGVMRERASRNIEENESLTTEDKEALGGSYGVQW